MDRTNSEPVSDGKSVVHDARPKIAAGPTKPGIELDSILTKLDTVFERVPIENILQSCLSFEAVPILIGKTLRKALADIPALQRACATIDKSKEASRSAEIDVRVNYRKNDAVAHDGEVISDSFNIGEVGRR